MNSFGSEIGARADFAKTILLTLGVPDWLQQVTRLVRNR
jgi:hypothetical protein